MLNNDILTEKKNTKNNLKTGTEKKDNQFPSRAIDDHVLEDSSIASDDFILYAIFYEV